MRFFKKSPEPETSEQATAGLLLDLIRSIEPSIVTWDQSGRDRNLTVTAIGLDHSQACMRVGVFKAPAGVSLMFTSAELPDAAGLLQGTPLLTVTPENVNDLDVAQLIRDAFVVCRSALLGSARP